MVKILGFEINAAKKKVAADTAVTTLPNNQTRTQPSVPLKKAFPRAELGDSGTRMMHGIIIDDYNNQLNGIQGIKVFDEMRKSDGTVRAAMLAVTLPIRRAKWFVNPATEDPKDVEIANFVEHALFDWIDKTSWDDIIRQALLMLPFGVMLFEKVYGTYEHDGKTFVTLQKLAPRLPKSILQWELPDGTFGIRQIRQDGQIALIPGSKLVVFVNEREGDNWWGTSMLRAAYKHWYYKDNFYKIDAVAFERQGMGVPVLKMPDGYTAADEAKASQVMQNLRANESAYMLLPKDYEFEFADMGASSTRNPDNSINHHNKQILLSVLSQFLELGQSSNGGSKALSQDHSEFFLNAMESIANTITSEINKNLIPELVDMNFDGVTVYPCLDYSGITKVDVAGLGETYSKLVQAGAITPTEDDQQYLRSMLNLPPRTQEDVEKGKEEPSTEEQEDHMDIEEPEEEEEAENVKAGAKKAAPKKTTPADKKKVEEASKKKVAHEHKELKRVFAYKKNKNTFTSWRKLTFAEENVDFGGIEKNINKLEEGFTQQAKDLLKVAKDNFMKKLHEAIDKGDAKAIADLELDFFQNYKILLKKTMEASYQVGKVGAADELGVGAPTVPPEALKHIDLAADTIATKAMTDIESRAKAMATQALKTTRSTLQEVGAIDATLDTLINKNVDSTAALMVGQNVNDGRNDVFQRNTGLIYALQRSEVLDNKTCDFCLSMDGLTIEPTDEQWNATSVFHDSCRGIWVAIMKDEQGSSEIEITGVPAKVGDYFGGTPNDLQQPPRPIVRKDSPAKDYIDSQEE